MELHPAVVLHLDADLRGRPRLREVLFDGIAQARPARTSSRMTSHSGPTRRRAPAAGPAVRGEGDLDETLRTTPLARQSEGLHGHAPERNGVRDRSWIFGRTAPQATARRRAVRRRRPGRGGAPGGHSSSVAEHRLGKCADQLTTTGRHLCGPLEIVEPCEAVAVVEWVEPVHRPVPEKDGFTADGLGDSGVLALRVTGDVDATAERDRACGEALRQRRLARSDDAREHEVRRGDQTPCVEHPRVIDERQP